MRGGTGWPAAGIFAMPGPLREIASHETRAGAQRDSPCTARLGARCTVRSERLDLLAMQALLSMAEAIRIASRNTFHRTHAITILVLRA